MDKIEKPIIILGAGRSGTALVSAPIETHPDVHFEHEPSYVWRAGNAHIGHDMIPASKATEKVVSRIRKEFLRRLNAANKSRFAEKTPSNCLRVPFLLEVFPDAKLIHIVRDGRHVAVSARRKFHGRWEKVTTTKEVPAGDASRGRHSRSGGRAAVARHLFRSARQKLPMIPVRDAIHYLPKAMRTVTRDLGLRERQIWGTEFPGIRKLMRSHSLIEICALQWRMSVEGVLNATAGRPDVDLLTVKFEDVVSDFEGVVREIFCFAELDLPQAVPAPPGGDFDPSADPFTTDLSAEEQRRVMDHISSTLLRLGYSI